MISHELTKLSKDYLVSKQSIAYESKYLNDFDFSDIAIK